MKPIFFLIIFSFLQANLSWAKTGEIIFSSATEISPRKSISVYDIVETKNATVPVLEQLKLIQIANSETEIIQKADLVKKLRSINSHFKLPDFIKLIRSKQSVSRMELERKIKNHLTSQCQDCEFKISINSVPKNIDSNWNLDLNIDLNKKSVLIPVLSSDDFTKKGWITAEIKKYKNVLVLNQDIKIGEPIKESMFNLEMRDVSNLRNSVNLNSSIKGMQAGRFLPMGEVLKTSDLKKEVILKKGQIVKVLYSQDELQISISATAEESGAIGDVIKFKNSDSQKVFSARVIEKGVVEIE